MSGGGANVASAVGATVPGGLENSAGGEASFAAGQDAVASDNGSFVWGDGSVTAYSQGPNSFTALATGGFYFYTGSGGAELAPNGTSWTAISDRNAKKNFKPVDTVAVLDKLAQVPVEQWNYKWEKDTDTPNIGPMAQDFKAAFYPRRNDKGISTLEFDGVELAAIQGLNQKLQENLNRQDAENARLKQQNDSLAQRLKELEATVKQLAAHK